MTARSKYDELMALADSLNQHRLGLVAAIGEINKGICLLVGASDTLLVESANELDAGIKPVPIKLGEKLDEVVAHVNPNQRRCSTCGKPGHRAPTCPEAHKVRAAEKKAEKEEQAPVRQPGKRACSNCGTPGHRATTCPKPKKK